MSANVSVVSLDVLGKDGTFTVAKIEAWIQQTLQIVISYPALEAKVLTQGLYPGVGAALVDLAAAVAPPAVEAVVAQVVALDGRRVGAAGALDRARAALPGHSADAGPSHAAVREHKTQSVSACKLREKV